MDYYSYYSGKEQFTIHENYFNTTQLMISNALRAQEIPLMNFDKTHQLIEKHSR